MINITRNKQKFHAMILRILMKQENVFRKKIYPELRSTWLETANNLEHGVQEVEQTVNNYTRDLISRFQDQYTKVGRSWYDETVKYLEESKDWESIFWVSYNDWLRNESLRKVVSIINPSTIKALRTMIDKGIRDGLSNIEIAKKLRKSQYSINTYRAKTIAITETHNAFSKAVNDTIETSTTKMQEKEWSAALDERTRVDHAEANGQIVPMDDYFIVGGEQMEYPGDPNASGRNVIRCRCIALYHTVQTAKLVWLPVTSKYAMKGV